ncbi:MAG: sugar nucleotide-binding protein [Chloroflexi bacterium]|nr:sugar nucleotide-binding protein [Chloroflexota bacterium]
MAAAITQLIETRQYGVYHFTNAWACSRWEFANEILHQTGLTDVVNTPIQLKDYPRASTPPPYAALNNNVGKAIGIELRPWQDALADYITNHVTQ